MYRILPRKKSSVVSAYSATDVESTFSNFLNSGVDIFPYIANTETIHVQCGFWMKMVKY